MNNATIKELRELLRMRDEINAEIESLQNDIKQAMQDANTDTLTGPDYKVTYKPVKAARIDSNALKRDLPDIAARYTKETVYRRFLLV